MLTHFLIALSLAMDAFAVSVASGICIPHLKPRLALRAALAFGFFQFIMPIAGWFAGETFRSYIEGVDHWIAFALLALIGGKMLFEALRSRSQAACEDACADEGRGKAGILELKTLLLLALATSIDALAVGLSYSLINAPILAPAIIIGLVTFGLCLLGMEFGKRLGTRFETWAQIAGGLVLVGIGIKILAQHLRGAA